MIIEQRFSPSEIYQKNGVTQKLIGLMETFGANQSLAMQLINEITASQTEEIEQEQDNAQQ